MVTQPDTLHSSTDDDTRQRRLPGASSARILVAEPFGDAGLQLLKEHAEVLRPSSPEELRSMLADCDGLVVRSGTQVTRELLEYGPNLRIVARAGVGVDNIDVEACTARGVAVINAAGGNAVAVAEHALGLMIALARHFVPANASLRDGKWDRSRFTGIELAGRTLGTVGLGPVGSELVTRARALGMTVLAVDPYIPAERAERLGVQIVGLDELLRESDFISLHVPATAETRNMMNRETLAKMKSTAYLINCARGEVVDTDALLEALDAGVIAGAGIDVFTEEPAPSHPLAMHPKVLATPHLAGSTTEALESVAVRIAEQMLAMLAGGPPIGALNGPRWPEDPSLHPWLEAADKAGGLAIQLAEGQIKSVEIGINGPPAEVTTSAFSAAALAGLLSRVSDEPISWINAQEIAEQRGLKPVERRSHTDEPGVRVSVRTELGEADVEIEAKDGELRIRRILGFPVDLPLNGGHLLLTSHRDVPGVVGAIGTLLGTSNVNISALQVGRFHPGGDALMVMVVDDPITPEVLSAAREISGMEGAWSLSV
ncbi:MAG: phosphoglycerate dehydrogenase [Chloroflexota bacterium]